jgi:hypothetical protein
VPRSFPHAICTTVAVATLILVPAVLLGAGGQAPVEQTVRGRLAFVEPSMRRISVVPDGEVHMSDLFVDDGAEVREGDRVLTLSELVIEVGRRVAVRYWTDGERRVAASIIVDPPG